MKSGVFLLLALASAQAFPQWIDNYIVHPNERTYQPHSAGLGIIGGQVATPGKIPYQVGIYIDGSFTCGGSLVSLNYVLTAAHCVDRYKSGNVKLELVFGATNITDKTEKTQVRVISSEFVQHEKWSRRFLEYDIALIKLSTPIKETDYIKIVPIATGSKLYDGSQGTVSGWGFEKNQQLLPPISDVLKYLTNPVMTNDACMKRGGYYEVFLKPSMVCLSGEWGVGPCGGDSGGPLTVDGVQVGLVSWGYTSCDASQPTVFTRLTEYQSWIAEHSDVKF